MDEHKSPEVQKLERYASELSFSRLFACFVGGCFVSSHFLDNFPLESFSDFLIAYGLTLLSGVLFGISIRIVTGFFDLVAYNSSPEALRRGLLVFCLAFPVIFILLRGNTPLF